MSLDERFRQRESAFQRLLDRIGSGSRLAVPAASLFGGERLRPSWTEPARTPVCRAAAVAALYEENQPQTESPPPPPRQEFDLSARAEQIRRALAKENDAEKLRRLRRQFALLAHPDRAPGLNRAEAEAFMAEINAAIDQALKSQPARRAKP
jgi:hypothetical protein